MVIIYFSWGELLNFGRVEFFFGGEDTQLFIFWGEGGPKNLSQKSHYLQSINSQTRFCSGHLWLPI